MRAKLDAQLRGLGADFVPEPMARPYIESAGSSSRRWSAATGLCASVMHGESSSSPGRALQWWLGHFESAKRGTPCRTARS